MSTNLKPKRTLHDLEFKKQAVQLLNISGRPLAQVARNLGCSPGNCTIGRTASSPQLAQQPENLEAMRVRLAELEREAKLEGYDVDSVSNFVDYVIGNPARLWIKVSSDHKKQLQKVLFRKNVSFANGEFRTNTTCPLFSKLEKLEREKSELAPQA